MKKLSIIIVLLALASLCWGETLRHFHVHQLDYTSFAVTCDNGTAPRSFQAKDTSQFIVTCSK